MSTLYKTLCCGHEYFGINHSPVLETGYCLHCGYHPEIEKLQAELKEKDAVLNEWLTFEDDSIKENGPYIGKRINAILKRARTVLKKWKV